MTDGQRGLTSWLLACRCPGRWESPSTSNAHLVRPDVGGYRYGGRQEPDAVTVRAAEIRKLLREERQRISFNASSARALSVRRNQQIAQALCDGLKETLLAGAAELSRWTLRTMGRSIQNAGYSR